MCMDLIMEYLSTKRNLMFMVVLLLGVFSVVYCHHIPCVIKNGTAVCTSLNLSHVPKDLPPNIIKLDLSRNSIKILRKYSFSTYAMLKDLILDNNQINRIYKSAFNGLKFLGRLSIKGNNLTNVPADLPTNITELDLSWNNLAQIQNYSFKQCKMLQILRINNNKINTIDEFAFQGLSNLNYLSIAENNIIPTQYSEHVFQPLSRLTTLDLSKNTERESLEDICNYSDKAMSYLIELKEFFIDLCYHPYFGEGFNNMTNLEKLVFDYCNAMELDNSTFHNFRFSNITHLQLSGCKYFRIIPNIDEDILAPFRYVKILDLSNSYFSLDHALSMLHPFQNSSMDVINLHHVGDSVCSTLLNPYFISLSKKMMRYLKTICVKTLILSFNGIVWYESESLFSFDHTDCLVNFVLSANHFEIFYGLQTFEISKFALKATNLKTFDFSYFAVEYPDQKFLPYSEFYSRSGKGRKTELEQMNIIGNLYLPPNLETLRMSYVLDNKKLVPFIRISNSHALKHVDLSYITVGIPDLYFNDKLNLEYLDLSGIEGRELVAKENLMHSLQNTTSITIQNSNIDKTVTDGNNIFQFFKKTKVLNISNNHLDTLLPNSFAKMEVIETLNMSSNSFYNLPSSLLSIRTLTTLDVRYNRLETIEQSFTNWMEELVKQNNNFYLYLDGNNFYCSCENQNFIKWLLGTKVQLDKNGNYSFRISETNMAIYIKSLHSDQRFHELFAHCSESLWLRVGVISVVSSFILIGILTVIYQYRWRIIYFFYRKLKNHYIEPTVKLNFDYDFFIAYASDSTEWLIRTLVPKLENEWGLKLCLKDRDFLIGTDMTDTIISSIQKSKNVIFIITPMFIKRKWSAFEIEMAKFEMFEQKGQTKIIVITKGGTSQEHIPKEFISIWRNVCLIEWNDEDENEDNFWYSLKLEL